MDREQTRGCPPALAIAGMHRSGTSLTASIIAAAGIHLGDELMGPAASNPRGHFEDLEFYGLHQRILAAAGLSMEGFTCQESIDVPAAARAEAEDLVRRRRAAHRPWGWKDPRTVLFLDFWADMIPEARWLFVVRPPEEVADSLFRRGDTAFVVNPRHAIDVWAAYSRRILDFVRRHPDRSAIVDLARVIADPAGLVRRASELVGTPLVIPDSTYEPGLLTTGLTRHRADLVNGVRPEAYDLYTDLLRVDGTETAITTSRPTAGATLAEAGMQEWVSACRVRADLGGVAAREADARREIAQMASDLDAARAANAQQNAGIEDLHAAVAALSNDLARERVAQAALDHQLSERLAERDKLQAELGDAFQCHADAARHWEQLLAEAHAERDQIAQDRAQLAGERDQLATERDQLATERDQLATERDRFAAERDRFAAERDRFAAERDRFAAERDQLAAEHETLRAELVAAHDAECERLIISIEAKHDMVNSVLQAERDRLVAQLAAERDEQVAAFEAERAGLVETHEAAREDLVATLTSERDSLEAERDALVAQLEAERMIHESLRMDMTGRIEAAVAGQGRTILG